MGRFPPGVRYESHGCYHGDSGSRMVAIPPFERELGREQMCGSSGARPPDEDRSCVIGVVKLRAVERGNPETSGGGASWSRHGYTADIISRHGVLQDGVHFVQKPFSILAPLAQGIRKALE